MSAFAPADGVPAAKTADAARVPIAPRAADFRAPLFLRSPHVQSVLASSGLRRWMLKRRRIDIERDATEHFLDCGDGVRLQGFHSAQHALSQARGLVVLLHGWEGSADSTYVVNTGARLLRDGFDVFRLNFRDHGDTHHLNPGLFHSALLDEAVAAVANVERLFAPRALGIAGFSLGGNFALRVALRAPEAGIRLAYALAVCPVISPASGLFGLENGPWFYQHYFLHKWRKSLRRKRELFPDVEWFAHGDLAGDLRALTGALVLRHTDFETLDNYLDAYSIAGDRLASLQVPATILTAADDPVIPVADFRSITVPALLELDIASHGGHCGFISDYALHSFTEDYIARRMLAHVVVPGAAVDALVPRATAAGA